MSGHLSIEPPDALAPAGHQSSRVKFVLTALFLFTFAVRTVVVVMMPEGLSRDTDAYRKLAESLRQSGTFGFAEATSNVSQIKPTAFRPPLYPLILSIFIVDGRLPPAAVGGLHIALGILTTLLVWDLARRWQSGSAAAFAGFFTACDPILLGQSTQLMTETLATFFGCVSLWGLTLWQRRPRILAGMGVGLLLGMACLSRPTFLPWCVLVIATFAMVKPVTSPRWLSSFAIAAGLCIAILPWGARNYFQFGHWKFTTTHGGYTLLLANNPSFYRFLREGNWGSLWDSAELDRAWLRRAELPNANLDLFRLSDPETSVQSNGVNRKTRSEFEDDALGYALARRFIREDPGMFAYSCLYRIGALWHVLPHSVSESESVKHRILRWGVACWYVTVFALAGTGAWRLRGKLWERPWVWGVLLCVTFTGLHALYWSNMRMRAPLVPVIAILAGVGVQAMMQAFQNRSQRPKNKSGTAFPVSSD